MIYHKWSFVGFMLWVRYALLRLRPFTSLSEIYAKYLEGPGTKAYSVAEARRLFQNFRSVEIRTVLTHGDLLSSQAGQRHEWNLIGSGKKSLATLAYQEPISKKWPVHVDYRYKVRLFTDT